MAAERAVEPGAEGAVLLEVSRAGTKCIAAAAVPAELGIRSRPLET